MRRQTYKGLAEETDRQFEAGIEPEDLEPVQIKVSKPAGASLTIRLTGEEFALLRRHTRAQGLNMSEFARDALLKAIAEEEGDPMTRLLAGAQHLAKLARKVEASRKGTH